MALSMDEQRVLAEIERRLAAEEPRLAASLTTFRRPGPAAVLRSPRVRLFGSLGTVMVVALISLLVYAVIPFRGHSARTPAEPGQTAITASGSSQENAKFSAAPSGTGVTKASAQANAEPATGASVRPGSGAAVHGKATAATAASGTAASAKAGSTGAGSTASGSTGSASTGSGSAASASTQQAKAKATGSAVPARP
jgi:hypothetical protein